MKQKFWRLKYHWGRKLEGYKWFRGWRIHHRADMSIKFVTWKIRVFGKVITI